MCQLDLSEVFVTKDASKRGYINAVPATSPDGELGTSPDTSPDCANYYEKGEEKREKVKRETIPTVTGQLLFNSSSTPQTVMQQLHTIDSGNSSVTPRVCESNSSSTASPPIPSGLELRDGVYFTSQGTRVHPDALAVLLKQSGDVQ